MDDAHEITDTGSVTPEASAERRLNYFHDMTFNGHPEGLRYRDCIFWYDGPLLFTAQDGGGGWHVVFQIDDDRDGRVSTFIVVPVTVEDYNAMAAKDLDIVVVNRLTRGIVIDGAQAVEIKMSWDDCTAISTRNLDKTEADSHIGSETDD
jgi:hypothetical protein